VNYTDNYNLRKPEPTDPVDIDDLNYNADEIDSLLKGLADGLDGITPEGIGAETPTGAQTKVDTHEAKAAPHSGHETPAGAQAKVNAHEQKVAPHSGHETPDGAQTKANAAASAALGSANSYTDAVAEVLEKRIDDNQALAIRTAVKPERRAGKHTKRISGYGMLSIPNNANGQVSDVVIKGLTATNLVTNGNFETDITGWYAYAPAYTEATFDAGTCKITTLKTHDAHTFQIAQEVAIIDAHKYYLSFDAYSNVSGRTITIGFSNTNVFKNMVLTTGVTVADSWVKFSLIKDGVADVNKLQIGRHSGTGFNNVGDYLKLDNIMFIDLTATFGAGNEPTKEQCDKMFANWFDGTKSTVSASRLKSVGKNLFDINGEIATGRISTTGEIESTGRATNIRVVDDTIYYTQTAVNGGILSPPIKVPIDKSVVIRRAGETDVFGVAGFRNGIMIYREAGTSLNKITVPAGADEIRFWHYSVTTGEKQLTQPMVSYEDSAYEPYTESTVYLPNVGELRSLPNGTKDEVRVSDKKLIKRVSNITPVQTASLHTPSDTVDYYGVMIEGVNILGGVGTFKMFNYNEVEVTAIYDTFINANYRIVRALQNGNLYFKIPKNEIEGMLDDNKVTQWLLSNSITLIYQLAEPVVTPLDVIGELRAYPNGTVWTEPAIAGFMTEATKVVTTEDYPISEVRKVIRYDISSSGHLVKTDVTADVTIGDNNTSLTIANFEQGKTYFYDCSYPAELTTQPEVMLDVVVENGIISHDYAAAAADWVLDANEGKATMLICTNAGGAARIVAPDTDGKIYVVKNDSGQTITIKTASSTGVAIDNGKTATVIYTGADYIKISEV